MYQDININQVEMGDYRAASVGPEWECHVKDEGGSSTGEILLSE